MFTGLRGLVNANRLAMTLDGDGTGLLRALAMTETVDGDGVVRDYIRALRMFIAIMISFFCCSPLISRSIVTGPL